jgi:hypothetical protein
MASFKVINIIDGDTIRVSPNWVFEGRKGDIVKIFGYGTPQERSQPFAINRLRSLLLNNLVDLKNARKFNPNSEALLCSVFLNEVDVAKYFPEFPMVY